MKLVNLEIVSNGCIVTISGGPTTGMPGIEQIKEVYNDTDTVKKISDLITQERAEKITKE